MDTDAVEEVNVMMEAVEEEAVMEAVEEVMVVDVEEVMVVDVEEVP